MQVHNDPNGSCCAHFPAISKENEAARQITTAMTPSGMETQRNTQNSTCHGANQISPHVYSGKHTPLP